MMKTQWRTTVGRKLASLLQSGLLGLVAVLALCTLPASRAQASIGTMDNVPGATLLLPYFETDLGNENGVQTAVRVTNASATAILLNVTLWTDYGVPTYSFPIYLTGYNSADLDMRLLFKGIPPVTASAGQDPTDTISPKGQFSQDINFASCNGVLPPPAIPAATVTALRAAHTGQGSTLFGGMCSGVAHGDTIARGYVTMDTVNSCGGEALPSDANYFTNRATNQNVAIGNVLYVNRSQNLAFSEPLVSLEASANDPLTSTAGSNTFYGRLVGFSSSDHREPVSAITQGRFINGGVFNGGTDLVVWRDPGVAVTPFTCGNTPTGYPLTQQEAVAFDEEENFTAIAGSPFPYATQRVSGNALSPYTFGFFRLNLTRSGGDAAITGRQQSYVSMHYKSGAGLGNALPAQQLSNASNPASSNPDVLGP
jgi:hypothetical protein